MCCCFTYICTAPAPRYKGLSSNFLLLGLQATWTTNGQTQFRYPLCWISKASTPTCTARRRSLSLRKVKVRTPSSTVSSLAHPRLDPHRCLWWSCYLPRNGGRNQVRQARVSPSCMSHASVSECLCTNPLAQSLHVSSTVRNQTKRLNNSSRPVLLHLERVTSIANILQRRPRS